VRGLNQFIDQEKPWEIAKTGDEDHLREVLANQVSDLLEIAELLQPFMPGAAAKIQGVFESGIVRPLEGTLFPKLEVPAEA
jgi:methionyl-tRNA synthetase